jgi:CHAT domain-containing protein
MRYGKAIALAGLMAGLAGLAPVMVMPGVAQVVAQTREQQKAEGDRLLLQGLQQYQARQFESALQSWEQALSIYREIQDRHGEGRSLLFSAGAYAGLGNGTRVLELSQQALAIAKELKDSDLEKFALQILESAQQTVNSSAAVRLYRQGVEQYQTSQFEAALQSWQELLQVYRAVKDREGEGAVLGSLGNVYYSLGNYGRAIEYQEQSLQIARELKDRQGEGVALGNLGSTYFALGNYGKAIEYQEQSLQIARELKNHLGESQSLGNLGVAYQALGNYDKAIEYHGQRLAISRRLKHLQGEGNALGNLGSAYRALGDYSKAIEYHAQALAILRKIKDRQGEGVALGNLGLAYDVLGNYDKAIEYHGQRLAIAREIKDRRGEGNALNNLGFTLFKFGQLGTAKKTLMEGIAVWESIRQTGTRNDTDKVSIFEIQANTYRTLQQVLIAQNLPNAALEIAERGRGRAFVELLAQRLADSRPATPVPVQFTLAPPNLQQIQQIAQAQGATLVQYSIIYNDFKLQGKEEARQAELYIWVIAPTGEITFRKADLKPLWQQQNSSLAELVDTTRQVIGARSRGATLVAQMTPEQQRQNRQRQTQRLRQLHQILIDPIANLLPKDPNQRVIFMPQGELLLVPFPALLDANNKPLIAQHTILTAPSIQVLELTRQQRDRLASRKSVGGESLIVGNPTMPKIVTQLGDTPVQLSNLPGAKQEALEIAKLFNTQAMTGAQATKTAIAQKMPNARIIHLATHGLLDDTKGLGVPGAIALAPSGNGQLNDGLLTSDEILDMKLNAELVVLSACDTGRGRITGDGVIGLSRSLITAGVPSIIVSLWKVPDDATALLMTEFYKNLKKSPDKAQALRQAMLTTKQQYPDPLNWAAFTLIGEAE